VSSEQAAQHLPLPNYAAVVAISGRVRVRLFGGAKVPLFPFLTQEFLLFWEGTLLGRKYSNNLRPLIGACIGSEAIGERFEAAGQDHQSAVESVGQEWMVAGYIQHAASNALRELSSEPNTLLDLFCGGFASPELDFRSTEAIPRLERGKVPAQIAILRGSDWFISGLSVGGTCSDLADNLMSNVYGTRTPEWWHALKRAGGLGPPRQEDYPALDLAKVTDTMVGSLLTMYGQQVSSELVEDLRAGDDSP
jgi:hypothetical protein